MARGYQYVVTTGQIIGARTWPDGKSPPALQGDRAYFLTNQTLDPETTKIVANVPVKKPRLLSETDCLAAVDNTAARLRQTARGTMVSGQASIDRRKQAEIDKMKSLGSTLTAMLAALNLMPAAQRAADYPLLTIEMQVMGYANLTLSYTLVSAAIAACDVKLNAIEKTRRQTKLAIRAATTLEAKNAAMKQAAWPA